MLIITYPVDDDFLCSPLVLVAKQDVRLCAWHDLLVEVFSAPRTQLAMRHDLAGADTQARWKGCHALPLVVTGCLAVVRRLMGWSYRVLADEVKTNAGWRWVCHPWRSFTSKNTRCCRRHSPASRYEKPVRMRPLLACILLGGASFVASTKQTTPPEGLLPSGGVSLYGRL